MSDQEIHVYRNRHVFVGDDHVAKYAPDTGEMSLRTQFEHLADRVKQYFGAVYGASVRVILSDDLTSKKGKPLPQFPDHIKEKMTPLLGHRSPEVIQYALANFSREDFLRLYPDLIDEALPDNVEPANIEAFAPALDKPDDVPLNPVAAVVAGAVVPFTPTPSADADDEDDHPLASITVNPAINDGVQGGEPETEQSAESDSGTVAGEGSTANAEEFRIDGDDIFIGDKPVASIVGDERQLRMKSGQAPRKAKLVAWLDEQKISYT